MLREFVLSLFLVASSLTNLLGEESSHDLVIYGATSCGMAAAVQAKRMGLSVVVIEPTDHVGGLTTNGLGYTDTGDKRAIGGVAREFYQEVKRHYDHDAAWTHTKQSSFAKYRELDDAMWTFEPHVAEAIFERWIKANDLRVDRDRRLDRSRGVVKNGNQIVSIRCEGGAIYRGKMFIDATYEGDLMAASDVSYSVGRESNSQYGESLNGVQKARNTHNHRFTKDVDPYVEPGNPSSGLLPDVAAQDPGKDGQGDKGLQAFCYRMCMTQVADNQTPFTKPDKYDPLKYELLLRNFEAGDLRWPLAPGMLPNGKTDTNNNGAVSTDYIGMNHDYPEASYAERERILKEHEDYQKGLMWTLAHHPRVPEELRRLTQSWGLAKDEFTGNGNWPRQIYVRESRRMVSSYVMSELDCRRVRIAKDSIGLGSYNMDSHNVHRYVDANGFAQDEGDVQVSPGGAYLVSYRSITPKEQEACNLLVPVCLSATHIAFGSIRMEPVFMVLGQSAATAAAMALERDGVIQHVPYDRLRSQLVKDRQVLDLPSPTAAKRLISASKLPGVIVDDSNAEFVGTWSESNSTPSYVELGYRHDGNLEQGRKRAIYRAKLAPGDYHVRASYSAFSNRSSETTVVIRHAKGTTTAILDQRKKPTVDGLFEPLGVFSFDGRGEVEINNQGANGHVIADAIQFEPEKK